MTFWIAWYAAMSDADLLAQLRLDRNAEARPQPRRWPWLLLGLLVGVVLGALAWPQRSAQGPQRVTLATALAASAPVARASVLDASGYVVARRQATVSSKVTGKVVEVLIEEGMSVEAGQVLARLDDAQQQAEHALRSAQLAAARAQLGELDAQLRQAEADRGRQRTLAGQGLASASALEAIEAQVDTLRARIESARRQVEVAARSLALVDVALEDTIIRAPFAGIVIAKAAQPGEMISPVSAGGGFTRTGIGTLVDMASLEVEVDVNEAFIGRVSTGMQVNITLNAYPDWRIPGEVIALIPAADRTRATVPVRVGFAERDARIVPDMGARVAFLDRGDAVVESAAASGVRVPDGAVTERGGAPVVFVYRDGQVQLRAVRAGRSTAGQRELLAGVEAGEQVVLSPPPGLADGDRVEVSP